ncbi:hypothetical protein L1887_62064 [Cichorium endivia]|nr:hypothetical protein L1887_62064 [Cichorium endivia]
MQRLQLKRPAVPLFGERRSVASRVQSQHECLRSKVQSNSSATHLDLLLFAGCADVHLALDELDALVDVGLGFDLVLLDEYGSDEFVHLVVLRELAELLGHLFVLAQLRVELLARLDGGLEGCHAGAQACRLSARWSIKLDWERGLTSLKLLVLCYCCLHVVFVCVCESDAEGVVVSLRRARAYRASLEVERPTQPSCKGLTCGENRETLLAAFDC